MDDISENIYTDEDVNDSLIKHFSEINGIPFVSSITQVNNLEEWTLDPELEIVTSSKFTPEWIDEVCYNGYFPMAEDMQIGSMHFSLMLVKHHIERAVLKLSKKHFSKKIIPLCSKYELKIDYDFESCVKCILGIYPETWLTPSLLEGFYHLHKKTIPELKTSVHSVELYDKQTGELVAGEIGFRNGSLYSSLSGFHKVNNSGNVQMYMLSEFLEKIGCKYWDFGMVLPYKLSLGCEILSREQLFNLQSKLRDKEVKFAL